MRCSIKLNYIYALQCVCHAVIPLLKVGGGGQLPDSPPLVWNVISKHINLSRVNKRFCIIWVLQDRRSRCNGSAFNILTCRIPTGYIRYIYSDFIDCMCVNTNL